MLKKLFEVSEYTDIDKLRDKILKSANYKKLSVYPPLKSVYNELYDRSVLEADDIDTLKSKKDALEYILPAAEKLQKAIIGGNAWDLEPGDKPDFTSAESLKEFIEKLVCSDDLGEELHNITNITENDIMKIFEESTIKEAKTLFYNVDLKDISKTNEEIIENLNQNGYWYCVEPSGIYEAKSLIDGEIESLEIRNFMAKRGLSWIRLAKLGFAGVAISAVFFVTRIGVIPDTLDFAMLGASLGISVLYFLVG